MVFDSTLKLHLTNYSVTRLGVVSYLWDAFWYLKGNYMCFPTTYLWKGKYVLYIYINTSLEDWIHNRVLSLESLRASIKQNHTTSFQFKELHECQCSHVLVNSRTCLCARFQKADLFRHSCHFLSKGFIWNMPIQFMCLNQSTEILCWEYKYPSFITTYSLQRLSYTYFSNQPWINR